MTASGGWRALIGGLVAGFAGGLFGVGGGILLVPMLASVFGATPHQANGTSLATIAATALTGLAVYAWKGNVAWGTAALLALGSIPAARWGARLAARSSRRTLLRVFAAFLVLVAARLLWRAPEPLAHTYPLAVTIAADVGLGVITGLLAGYLGVGGGIVMVPALVLLFGVPQPMAQGTSLAVILVTAPVGALEHARHGNVLGRLVPWLFAGAALGAPFASAIAQSLPHALLARGFAVFLLANALHTWRKAALSR